MSATTDPTRTNAADASGAPDAPGRRSPVGAPLATQDVFVGLTRLAGEATDRMSMLQAGFRLAAESLRADQPPVPMHHPGHPHEAPYQPNGVEPKISKEEVTAPRDTPTVTGDRSLIEIEERVWTVGTTAWGGSVTTVEAVSIAPDGVVTLVRSTGRHAVDVDAVLASLTTTPPGGWPTPDRQPYSAAELA
ncbi:MAG: hypothetical protein AAF743_04340, partial [Planctomycetota bacterium]